MLTLEPYARSYRRGMLQQVEHYTRALRTSASAACSPSPRRHLVLLLLGGLLCTGVRAQTPPPPFETDVCVFVQGSSTPVAAATVEASIEGGGTAGGMTGEDGCVALAIPVTVAVEETAGIPGRFIVTPPFPNPSAGRLILPIESGATQSLRLVVYDLLGRQALPERPYVVGAGTNYLALDLSLLPDGVYFYRLFSAAYSSTGKLVKAEGVGTAAPASSSPATKRTGFRLHLAQTVQFVVQKNGFDPLTMTTEVEAGEVVDVFLTQSTGTNFPPVIASQADVSVVEGQALALMVIATDADGDAVSLSISITTAAGAGVPPGFFAFEDHGGGEASLSITPGIGDTGAYNAVITATDGQAEATAGFSISVITDPGDTASMIPLIDLGVGTYLGFQGGLYPAGQNEAPAAHHAAGLAFANSIEPLDVNGVADPDGKYVLLSIGMSNTTQEFCSQDSLLPCDAWTFMGQAAADPDVNTQSLVIVNGARSGQSAANWVSPDESNYNRIKDDHLQPLGLTEAQVQAVWVKVANPMPTTSLPDPQADAYLLKQQMGDIARALRARYSNLKQIFFSSRIYAGYANGNSLLNPEPYAYESGFAVKWLIEAQIDQMGGSGIDPDAGDMDYNTAAWSAWAAYLWADGTNPRSDGLVWVPDDFAKDFTHPATSGEEKVGALLLDFFKSSPYTACWFLKAGTCE